MSQIFRAHFSLVQILLALLVFTLSSSPVELASSNTTNEDYFKSFVDPDLEILRKTPVTPLTWHVKKTLDILKMWGKSGEEHTITTEDGYILSLFRITPLKEKAPPVLFLHGLLASPETWILRGKDDLAIILNEAGYDVWLGCYRGSNYGRRHVKLNVTDEKFWNFSFHEHGVYDTPAMIDRILSVTASDKTAVIAHSMGNAVFMSMLAIRPEYNAKVNLFEGMAPYAVVQWELSPVVEILLNGLVPKLADYKLGFFERQKINTLAIIYSKTTEACVAALKGAEGENLVNTDRKLIGVLLAYFPSGTSTKVLEHLYQIRKGQFRQFDYGSNSSNLAHYNQIEPPRYNLTQVRVPTHLYFGVNDTRVSIKGEAAQVEALPNVIQSSEIPEFIHLDFIIGNTRQVYDPILEDLRKYAPTNQ